MISDFDIKRYERHKENIEKVLKKKFGQFVVVELINDFEENNYLESFRVYVKVLIDEVSFTIALDDVLLITSGYEKFFYKNHCKCDTIKFIIKNVDKFKLYEGNYYIKYMDLIHLLGKNIT